MESSSTPLADAFLRKWKGAAPADLAPLESTLRERAEEARRRFPEPALRAEDLAAHLAERTPPEGDPVTGLGGLQLSDLLLAWAALAGSATAQRELDAALGQAAAAVARVDGSRAFVDEVVQQLRERLLLGSAGGGARLVEYSGRGPLAAWARVIALRLALNRKGGAAREVPLAPDALVRAAGAVTGGAPSLMGVEQARLLQSALTRALAELSADDRMLLRYHFADGLPFERIAPLFGTHRTTISRRMSALRDRLMARAREILVAELGQSSDALSSVLQAAGAHLDLSISVMLRTPAG
ncbi:MAG TPA: sigma factor-like helix-turn-helix DNA-binding protein [Myxococcales bacterium]|nr:sigma factor-like helix-turn-helix DNA-binding protein [Myxococcales bacterium]